jgi:hypothetical protein
LKFGALAPSPQRERPPKGRSPGVGPLNSWLLAEWYSIKHKMTRDDARRAVASLKKTDPKKHLELQEDFKTFVEWYAEKHKQTVDAAKLALRSLDKPTYKTRISEFNKRSKK